MTLTTEQLRNLMEFNGPDHDSTSANADAWEVNEMAAELLANREAQPVAWEMRYWNNGYNCWHEWERITAEQHAEMSVQHAADNDYEFRALYDAQPAPVSDDAQPIGYAANGKGFIYPPERRDRIKNPVAVYTAPPAPAAISELLEAMAEVIRISDRDHDAWNKAKTAITACRAAMLAAAPEGGR